MTEPSGTGSSDLSFDRAIPTDPVSVGGSGGVVCANCHRVLTDQYYSANGEPVCAECRAALEAAARGHVEPVLLLRALVYGAVATLAGALLYWAVIRFANLEIGIVAIASGWMIGKSLRAGANGRGGPVLQFTGAALVYLSVALAYLPFVIEGSASQPFLDSMAFALQVPLRQVFDSGAGGIISAIIIGFGMLQAWQLAGTPAISLQGPFKVAGSQVG
jgi:hypothetical protein